MDKIYKIGGSREVAGRNSKAEEQSLVEKLTPLEPKAFAVLLQALEDHKDWAVKLFFQYQYGMPKQVVDQNNTHTINDFDIKDIVKFK
jgi:hypothetical protein